MMNIGTPDTAFRHSFLPNQGVGLAREEFIIASKIKVHPLALLNYNKLDKGLKKEVDRQTFGYKNKRDYFVEKLTEGIAQIAAAFYPKPVIVRFSDFKSNEYKQLLGGEKFEPEEENPMLGFRGAARYLDKEYQPAFRMEVEAIEKCREVFGLKNIVVMVPFCRTLEEGKNSKALIKRFYKGKDFPKVYVMGEIPSNVVLAEDFLDIFDGMSIGSNDLTQLVLGLDRDNGKISYIGNEKNPAVKEMISKVIKASKAKKKYCGICGQAPSDYPKFNKFLVEEGIESISLNPDTVIKTTLAIAKKEKRNS